MSFSLRTWPPPDSLFQVGRGGILVVAQVLELRLHQQLVLQVARNLLADVHHLHLDLHECLGVGAGLRGQAAGVLDLELGERRLRRVLLLLGGIDLVFQDADGEIVLRVQPWWCSARGGG